MIDANRIVVADGRAMQPPSWQIGGFRFERYPRDITGRGRWGCCWDNMIGVANHRTPAGAFLAVRRFRKREGYSGSILRFAYGHIPSFRREEGGLYDLYVQFRSHRAS
jgi:hypothetical protein